MPTWCLRCRSLKDWLFGVRCSGVECHLLLNGITRKLSRKLKLYISGSAFTHLPVIQPLDLPLEYSIVLLTIHQVYVINLNILEGCFLVFFWCRGLTACHNIWSVSLVKCTTFLVFHIRIYFKDILWKIHTLCFMHLRSNSGSKYDIIAKYYIIQPYKCICNISLTIPI